MAYTFNWQHGFSLLVLGAERCRFWIRSSSSCTSIPRGCFQMGKLSTRLETTLGYGASCLSVRLCMCSASRCSVQNNGSALPNQAVCVFVFQNVFSTEAVNFTTTGTGMKKLWNDVVAGVETFSDRVYSMHANRVFDRATESFTNW